MSAAPIRILVVDDSLIFRHAVADALAGEKGIEVIGSVRNGAKALEFMQRDYPDLLTLDLQMPELDGLETLRRLRRQSHDAGEPPAGVIMLSAHTRAGADSTIEALELGAFDFVTKPAGASEEQSRSKLKQALVPRIHHWAARRSRSLSPAPDRQSHRITLSGDTSRERRAATHIAKPVEAIVIGVSTGGPKALTDMLPELCAAVSQPILIVQHMPAAFTASLAESLDRRCSHRVIEGAEGMVVAPGAVYIAPGGRHMIVRRGPADRMTLGVNDQPPENGCKPSVDVLFRSAAAAYGSKLIACIMTGMGSDGARSLRAIKRAGGGIIAQDQDSSVVWGMPGSAVETGLVDAVVDLKQIPAIIADRIRNRNETQGERQ